MRKSTLVLFILMSFLVVGLMAGCGGNAAPGGATNDPPAAPPQEIVSAGVTKGYIPTLLAKKVDSMPEIDGNPDDPQWKQAVGIASHNTKLQAIYTDTEIALMYTVEDPSMSIVTPGCWYYDGDKFVQWRNYREELDDPVYRSWEMYNMAWETSDFALDEGGCNYMCHEDDSGVMHHMVPPGSSADLWNFMCKHGFGPGAMQVTGSLLGSISHSQAPGPISFLETDSKDPFQVTSGTFNFVGYLDERIQTWPDNPDFMGTALDTETGKYCTQCHTTQWMETYPLQGKPGKMLYRNNSLGHENMSMTEPEYIKLYPENFADATLITEKDIAEGRAVKIADLSKAEVEKAWARYKELNCLVPEIILQEPSGNLAQVMYGARWSDGIWTVEIKRARVTGNPHDVQFDDISKSYSLATAVSFGAEGKRESGGFGNDVGIRVMLENPIEN
ncbi:MAG: hypothetical protein WDA53_06390 [Bacillota bacterium]